MIFFFIMFNNNYQFINCGMNEKKKEKNNYSLRISRRMYLNIIINYQYYSYYKYYNIEDYSPVILENFQELLYVI